VGYGRVFIGGNFGFVFARQLADMMALAGQE
jgi:hypothetical protein